MNKADYQDMIKYFQEQLGEDLVVESIFERIKNSLDSFPYRADKENLPLVVVLPESTEQVSKIVKYAYDHKIPLFVKNSGTNLNGSARPHVSGIVINTRRMTKYHIYEENCYFECEPGIRCQEMSDILEQKGYFLPMWPGSKKIASIGGIASNNTSAHIIDCAIGKPGDYILGLEVVLPNGDIIETGTTGLRRPAGTDLTKFFVSGDGLLGVITRVRIRLVPKYCESYGIAILPDLVSLAKSVQRIFWDKCPPPLFMEFMCKETSKIGYEVKGMKPPAGPVLLVMATGETQEIAGYKMKRIMESIKKEGPLEAYIIESEEEWHKLLSAREVIAPYVMQMTKKQIVTSEIVSNLSSLVEAIKEAEHFADGIPILEECDKVLYGHIGGLTIHAAFLLQPSWSDEKLRKAVDAIIDKERVLNVRFATCGGEWGQFSKRTKFFIDRYGERSYNIVKEIKKQFDPYNILNPGQLEGYR